MLVTAVPELSVDFRTDRLVGRFPGDGHGGSILRPGQLQQRHLSVGCFFCRDFQGDVQVGCDFFSLLPQRPCLCLTFPCFCLTFPSRLTSLLLTRPSFLPHFPLRFPRFASAVTFNGDISSWRTTSANSFEKMFHSADVSPLRNPPFACDLLDQPSDGVH